MIDTDVVSAVLRALFGVVMLAHGYNHLAGPGGIAGTAAWFEGIGLRPGRVHAWLSSLVELAVGVGLLAGLLLPVAAAGGIGIMAVAGLIVHRPNGFFIFREGYEYVLVVGLALAVLAAIGPGRLSLDHALGIDRHGWGYGLAALLAGLAGALLLLATSYRPAAAPPA
ncbi:MAG TPA: DoxX family protein [Mycobacteriales bacterium]|nr:DoxX family protein [Mycobacteriales bacterium]